jgi:hypothetical protein
MRAGGAYAHATLALDTVAREKGGAANAPGTPD